MLIGFSFTWDRVLELSLSVVYTFDELSCMLSE